MKICQMYTVASRHLNLGPDQPEGWSGMADTTSHHPPAGDGEHQPNPNQRDGRHLAGQPGKGFKRHSGADGKGRRVTRQQGPSQPYPRGPRRP
ncbi:unnamed protein product [Arctogadus glacialis]